MTHPDTIVTHSGAAQNPSNAVSPPIYQTTAYTADSAEEFVKMATAPRHPGFYTRYGNPNHAQAEQIIADLEGAESALLAATGMGAITTTAFALLRQSDHVIAQTSIYAGTISLLQNMLPRFGVSATFVDQEDLSALEAAIQPNTKLIIVETPSNPLMKLTDLRAVAEMARTRGIVTLCDNTFATPINQQPLALGIDLVVHSATKYMGGHTDLMAGALAGHADMIETIWRTLLVTGATLNAFDSWLLIRGLRTLKLRVEKQNQNALAVAQMLVEHPQIEAVHYPGLDSHPQHDLARRQMAGFGGMVSFQIKGGYAKTDRFISALTLIARAASLGGVHSTIVHPAAMWAGSFSEAELIEKGVLPNLVRFSVGIEHADDLIADVRAALEA